MLLIPQSPIETAGLRFVKLVFSTCVDAVSTCSLKQAKVRQGIKAQSFFGRDQSAFVAASIQNSLDKAGT